MGLLSKAVNDTERLFSARAVESPDNSRLLAVLVKAKEDFSVFVGLVFEAENPDNNFAGRLSCMISDFASVSELREGRCLILGGASVDCELLAHRLSASIPGKKIFSFGSCEDAGKAADILTPYL